MPKPNFSNDLASIIKACVVLALGGKCAGCGGTLLSVLEPNHWRPEGRQWSARKLSRMKRALAYCEDYKRGDLNVLCRRCNAIDGARRGNWRFEEAQEELPF